MAENKLKNGQLSVSLEKEEMIWKDRKRTVFLGLPWSFTKYRLTASRLFISRGFFTRREEEIRLYRISDISLTQTLGERMAGLGTLTVRSSDVTTPEIKLEHIVKVRDVKDVLSQCVENARRENGVRTSELVGGGAPGPHPAEGGGAPEGGEHPALGPEVFPDANHNGVDDRTE